MNYKHDSLFDSQQQYQWPSHLYQVRYDQHVPKLKKIITRSKRPRQRSTVVSQSKCHSCDRWKEECYCQGLRLQCIVGQVCGVRRRCGCHREGSMESLRSSRSWTVQNPLEIAISNQRPKSRFVEQKILFANDLEVQSFQVSRYRHIIKAISGLWFFAMCLSSQIDEKL